MRIAFVIAHISPAAVGGAENAAHMLAIKLAERGHQITILTSCAHTFDQWEDVYEPGVYQSGPLEIIRFPTTPHDPSTRDALNLLMLQGERLNASQQLEWIQSGEHSYALYAHIERYSAEYDHIITTPYLSTIAFMSSWVSAENTIIWPCLHEERYAYFEPYHLLFESVSGAIFNTIDEMMFARHTLSITPKKYKTIGVGVTPPQLTQPRKPSGNLLYIGRRISEKNLPLLCDYVLEAHDAGHPIHLDIIGTGHYLPPEHPAFTIHGALDDAEKYEMLANALALVQPSLNESFSLVIMEAWLVGTPVMVHADCNVTSGHVERSQGGFLFRVYQEFVDAVTQLREQPHLATTMGERGRSYVLAKYSWDKITDRFEATLTNW